ncbi:MAG: hypothetical protein JW940_33565 [Polyangiaceae bacterium]|nr:hypothetical protein [Polyangiaceae bacterium]
MRTHTDAIKLMRFIEALGQRSSSAGRAYIVGGGSAVLYGWRSSTVDVDIKLDPEPAGAFGAIGRLKDELEINVELASPEQFIPELPGWHERSVHIGRYGQVDFYHYDFYAQALAKIERGHSRDLGDVDAMIQAKLVDPERLLELFHAVEGSLERYPAIDAEAFRAKVLAALSRSALATGEQP